MASNTSAIRIANIGFHLNYGTCRWNPPRIRIEGVMVKAMKPALVIAIIGITLQREIHNTDGLCTYMPGLL